MPVPNAITVTGSLAYANSGVGITSISLTFPNTGITINGQNYQFATFAVPTSATAIPISDLSTLGWGLFRNLDGTNYIQLSTATGGTIFARMLPGEMALFRYDATVTAPAALSHTAACTMQYLLLEN